MNTKFYFFLILLIIVSLNACNNSKEITDGSLAFQLKKYNLAKSLLKKEISSTGEKNRSSKILQLADSYRFSNDIENAEKWYQKAIDENLGNEIYYDLALMQKQNEKYNEAIASFTKYKDLTFDEIRSVSEIAICKKALQQMNSFNNMKVENLESINSSKSDFSSTIYKNGNLVISSTRNQSTGNIIHPWNGEKNTDLYEVTIGENKIINFDSTINTSLPEANITFNKDYTIAYFTRCDYSEDNYTNAYCHIYFTEKDGEYWYPPEKVKLFADSINTGQPFLRPDGKRLYFTSDWKSGYGGRDIYFVDIKDGEFGFPINAGFHVNTKGDEMFPTTDSKGNLYFSSNGRTGFGGLDIFVSKPENKGFSEAEQLPFPINSGADDFYLVYTKEYNGEESNGLIEEAFFTSSRKGGKGNDDIYKYKKELINTFALELYTQERSYKNPEDDESEFLGFITLNETEIKLINSSTLKEVNKISKKGISFFDLQAETDYKVLVSKNDYFNTSINISTKNLQDINTIKIILKDTVELKKIFPQKEIVIENIYYDLDKANLREESLISLDKLISFFQENNDLTIEIGSHTDSRGSDEYNLELSQRRAQSVVDYFISKNIPSEQLIAKGYGESKILNQCFNDIECSDEDHQANRRTSFRVVSSKGVIESK